MSRKNNKKQPISHENSIKKSNEISMAKLNRGLTLNQMQLLAYAIFSTQQNGKTEFRKYEFQNKFGIEKYQTRHAREDASRLMDLKFSIEDLENNYFEYWNVFGSIKYNDGLFNLKWNEDFLPHILQLKEKYVTTDLTITSQFKSGFTWILYDYLKAHYGYWKKELSKGALMRLFGVENRKTYQKNTSDFKKMVLSVAVNELNKYTELEVWYRDIKDGRTTTGFVLHWSTGENSTKATQKQISLLQEIHDEIDRRMSDYIALQNTQKLDLGRRYIIRVKDINKQLNEQLTSKQASAFIQESKNLYGYLQDLLENDGQERDTSVYFNWLDEE